MNNRSFDAWTRSLATRLSRRTALKTGGALVAAGALATPALLAADAQGGAASFWYTVIRRYRIDGPIEPVRQALMDGFRPLICAANGFRTYLAVEVTEISSTVGTADAMLDSDEQVLVTITAFGSQTQFEAFVTAEADWVFEFLGTALPEPEETIAGESYVRAGLPRRFDGTCPAPSMATTVPPTATATATPRRRRTPTATATSPANTPTPESTATPPPASTATPTPTTCTTEGCPCTGGVPGNCDPGLTCCQDVPGGAGMCRADCPTPTVPPCTSLTCPCNPDDPNACDEGLICCRSQLLCFPPDIHSSSRRRPAPRAQPPGAGRSPRTPAPARSRRRRPA
jgi:hypothetical protein